MTRVDPGEHADGGFHAVVGHGDAIVGRHVVAVQVGPGVAAVDADVAGENGQHADGAGRLLAVAAPLRALALVDGAGLRRGDLAGQRLDGGGGHERDGARPLRGLRGFVRAFAGDVVHVGLALAAQFLGHGGVVVADAVLREEVVVDQVLGDHDIGAGVHERRIGTGTHGDPLVGMNGRRVGVARVDDDDLRAGLLQAHHVVVGRAAAGHLRLAAVVAEQHDELGVGHVRRAVGLAAAVEPRQSLADLGRGIRAVGLQEAAVDAGEALHEVADVAVLHAGGVLHEHRLGAVLVEHLLVGLGDGIERLVPGDLLELALAALAHALERHREAVGVVDPAADGSAALAGAQLMVAVGVVAGVVSFHPGDLIVDNMEAQSAAALAVHRAVAPANFLIDRRGIAGLGELGVSGAGALRRAAEQRRGAYGGGPQAGQRGSLHERAARQCGLLGVRHGPPFPLANLFSSGPRPSSRAAPATAPEGAAAPVAASSSPPPTGRIIGPQRRKRVTYSV